MGLREKIRENKWNNMGEKIEKMWVMGDKILIR